MDLWLEGAEEARARRSGGGGARATGVASHFDRTPASQAQVCLRASSINIKVQQITFMYLLHM